MTDTNPFALLPLDNRPISYLLPKQIAEFAGIDLILPERKYLGDLNKGSDLEYIEKWCRGLINQTPTLVISLDNCVYGGLTQSRQHNFALDKLKKRVGALHAASLRNVYAFSSIMRIPNYNNSDEEKEYWKEQGEKIFRWSELMHKVGRGIKDDEHSHEVLIEKWYESTKALPPEVLTDYKSLREKNFAVNLLWLESLHENYFDYLIFSCDDSSQYGMNVIEADYLKGEIKKHRFSDKAKVISGTDEIPLVLLTKAVLKNTGVKPAISLYFNSQKGKDEPARYESGSIYNSVKSHLDILGIETTDLNTADIALCIHTADSLQGDHIFGKKPPDTEKNANELVNFLVKTNKPFIILDLAYANGSDPNLIKHLISSDINWDNCYGYSGLNTCSNSIGVLLAIGICRWAGEKNEKKKEFNLKAFKKCLLLRFLDDYAFQAEIRNPNITFSEINEKIKPYARTFTKILGLSDINVNCSLPWNRSFEIEINVL